MNKTLSFKSSLSPEQKARLQSLISKPEEKSSIETTAQARSSRKKQVREAIQWLTATYPDALHLETPKPLQLRIEKVLFAQGTLPYSRIILREAIACYAGSLRYQKAILEHSHRVTLDGSQAEEITDEHKQHARQRLEMLEEKKRRRIEHSKRPRKKGSSPHKRKPEGQSHKTGKGTTK